MVLMLIVGVLALGGVVGSIAAVAREARRPIPTIPGYDTRRPVP